MRATGHFCTRKTIEESAGKRMGLEKMAFLDAVSLNFHEFLGRVFFPETFKTHLGTQFSLGFQ